MEKIEEKDIFIAYKYAIEGCIGHSSEWINISSEDFDKISKNCDEYIKKRNETIKYYSTNPHSELTPTQFFNTIDSIVNISFEKCSDDEKIIAKSIIGYDSKKFIKQLKKRGISYDEIQNFISIINLVRENPDEGLKLLVLNYDLMKQFYRFVSYNKYCLQYGDYISIINKLEEIFIFENQYLQKGLERGKCKTK